MWDYIFWIILMCGDLIFYAILAWASSDICPSRKSR